VAWLQFGLYKGKSAKFGLFKGKSAKFGLILKSFPEIKWFGYLFGLI